MVSKDLLRKVKHIEIIAKNLLSTSVMGRYSSVFKGNGLEFSEVREYQYGDDIRSIDWNVSARHGKPFVKQFVEERELNVLIMIDMSASMRFSTHEKTKNEIAAEIAALLSLSAIMNNDKVGLLLFSEKIEAYLVANRSRYQVLRMIREILCYKPSHKKTNLQFALRYLNNVVSKESIVFLISDFWDTNYESELKIATRKHDIIPIYLRDNLEIQIPSLGKLIVEDLETGLIKQLDTTSPSFRKNAKESLERQFRKTLKIFSRMALDVIPLMTHESYFEALLSFFQKRMRRRS